LEFSVSVITSGTFAVVSIFGVVGNAFGLFIADIGELTFVEAVIVTIQIDARFRTETGMFRLVLIALIDVLATLGAEKTGNTSWVAKWIKTELTGILADIVITIFACANVPSSGVIWSAYSSPLTVVSTFDANVERIRIVGTVVITGSVDAEVGGSWVTSGLWTGVVRIGTFVNVFACSITVEDESRIACTECGVLVRSNRTSTCGCATTIDSVAEVERIVCG
jgi:hypothetical protein